MATFDTRPAFCWRCDATVYEGHERCPACGAKQSALTVFVRCLWPLWAPVLLALALYLAL